MDINEITTAILSGKLDNHIISISQTLEFRRKQAASETLQSLRPGDLVRVHNIKPKLLIGCTAKVVQVNRTTVTVDFPASSVPAKYAGRCRIPATCCTLVESNV